MANTKKRVLSLLMAVMMMLTALPTNAFAAFDLGDIFGDDSEYVYLVCEKDEIEHTDDCYVHPESCYHKHSEPGSILGMAYGCGYACTEHNHSKCEINTEVCDQHSHDGSCCSITEHSHSKSCCTNSDWKHKIYHQLASDKCTCAQTVHEHNDVDCDYCDLSTDHTHVDECYTCGIEAHDHNETCERTCGKVEGNLYCESKLLGHTLNCTDDTHHEHSTECYSNIVEELMNQLGIESYTEAAETAGVLIKCVAENKNEKCGISYKLGEVELILCEDHFCSVCTRLHKYCDCVEITFANIRNVADAIVVVKVKNGETVHADKVPNAEVADFRFLGWFDAEENEFSTEIAYDEDITFTAKYQALAEYEKIQNTINFIKNNFDLGHELGRLITLLSDGKITKDTILTNKDDAIRAVEVYLLTNTLTGVISKEQAQQITDLMKQGDEYIMMVAEWLWPEGAVDMPNVEDILNGIDYNKLAEELKELIAEKYGVKYDENWVENNKALAEQYIQECLGEVKSLTIEQMIILRDQIENKKAQAIESLNNIRAELRDQIKAEIVAVKEAINALLADTEKGLKLGKLLTMVTGLNADSAAAKGEEMQAALVAAIRMSDLDEKYQNAIINLVESSDSGMARVINWLWPTYTVTFVNENGDVLETVTVAHGKKAAYTGETPVKAADVQYTYTFAGWDKEFSAVVGDVTYTATYSAVVNEYTITFVNEDGEILETKSVAYGEIPAFTGETPVKAADVQYTYTFASWDKAFAAVTGDETYTATYTSAVNYYTVTFVDENGAVLETKSVAYGETPVYTGETPVKEDTAQFDYEFTNFGEIVPVTGDVTYTAQYSSNTKEYTVTFMDDKGVEIGTVTVEYGCAVTEAPEAPSKQGHYFVKWSGDLTSITEDITVVAEYDYVRVESAKLKINVGNGNSASGSTKGFYLSHWGKIYNARACDSYYEVYSTDSIMLESEFDYERTINDSVNVPGNVKRNNVTYTNGVGTSDNYYVLLDKGTFVACKSQYHLDYKAEFHNVVTFVVNGVEYKVDVLNGTAAEVPADINYEKAGYEFTGWDVDFSKVTKAMTVTAQYVKLHTVKFVNTAGYDKTITVKDGETIVLPYDGPLKRTGYNHTGWYWYKVQGQKDNFDFNTPVTGDMQISAKWEYTYEDRAVSYFAIINGERFELGEGSILNFRHPKTFGWTVVDSKNYKNAEFVIPCGDITVNGNTYTYGENSSSSYYVATVKALEVIKVSTGSKYAFECEVEVELHNTVTFLSDGEVVGTETVAYGQSATAPATTSLTKEGHTFQGWDADLTCVTENMTVNAVWERNVYTVTYCLPTGGSQKIQVMHGDLLEEFVPKTAAGEAFSYWYNSKGGAKLDYSKPVTGNMSLNAKCKWVVEDHDVTLMGVLNGENFNLGTAVFKDSYHARKYSDKWLTASQYDPAKIIIPDELASITVNGTTYTYGKGSSASYYTVEFTKLDSHMEKGYSYRYYGDIVLYNTVTYMNEGTVVGTEAVPYGQSAAGIDTSSMTKEGYHLTGWDADLTSVTENTTVNAEWEINVYTVTFGLPGKGGKRVIQVKHGEKLEPYWAEDACFNYEELNYWYNNKGGKKLDFETYVVTGDVTFSCKTKAKWGNWDVALFGTVNGENFELGAAVINNFMHAGNYRKNTQNIAHEASQIAMPETFGSIVVDGVEYTYGRGDNYYTVDFNNLTAYKTSTGYVFRYYGDITLYHKLVTAYVTVNGEVRSRTTLRNIEAGTVLTRDTLNLKQGQFLYEDVVVAPGTMYVEIGEHADRFACKNEGTLEKISSSNGVHIYECARCHRTVRTEDPDLSDNDAVVKQADRKVIYEGVFGTARPINLGEGYIKSYRAADTIGTVGAVSVFYDWNDFVIPTFGDITINGVTYAYGEDNGSGHYYTVNFFKDLCVAEVDGELVYVTHVEIVLHTAVAAVSVNANRG